MHYVLIYLGIFLGVFFEGEFVMISAVIGAHHGYLDIWKVVLIGIVGTMTSDCLYFGLGRSRGKKWLNQNSRFQSKMDIINRKISNHLTLTLLSYRFLYGFRMITPMILGTTEIKTGKFLFFSLIGTLVWAATLTIIGLIFGETLKASFAHVEKYEEYLFGTLIGICLLYLLIKLLWKFLRKKQ